MTPTQHILTALALKFEQWGWRFTRFAYWLSVRFSLPFNLTEGLDWETESEVLFDQEERKQEWDED